METKMYAVEIVKYGEPEEVIKRMGPFTEGHAYRVDTGVNINLNDEEYYTRIVEVI